MFTGIVEEIGSVNFLKNNQLAIKANHILADAKVGDSIAVNGVCLTINNLHSNNFTADVMPETLRLTNLGSLYTNDFVNLERALSLNTRLGGHIVTGHIDGIGSIHSLKKEGNAVLLTINANETIISQIVKKGSVTLDGASLTVAFLNNSSFTVSLIPHTIKNTVLQYKKPGDTINIETDIIGKYVHTFLLKKLDDSKENTSKITRSFLTEYGF